MSSINNNPIINNNNATSPRSENTTNVPAADSTQTNTNVSSVTSQSKKRKYQSNNTEKYDQFLGRFDVTPSSGHSNTTPTLGRFKLNPGVANSSKARKFENISNTNPSLSSTSGLRPSFFGENVFIDESPLNLGPSYNPSIIINNNNNSHQMIQPNQQAEISYVNNSEPAEYLTVNEATSLVLLRNVIDKEIQKYSDASQKIKLIGVDFDDFDNARIQQSYDIVNELIAEMRQLFTIEQLLDKNLGAQVYSECADYLIQLEEELGNPHLLGQVDYFNKMAEMVKTQIEL